MLTAMPAVLNEAKDLSSAAIHCRQKVDKSIIHAIIAYSTMYSTQIIHRP